MSKESIAIIGGGIGGLTSAYLLNNLYNIKLLEKQDRIGGNAHTFTTKTNEVLDVSVFAYASESYPNFFKLLSKLGLKNHALPLKGLGMSIYNMDTLETLLLSATGRSMLSPTQWKSLWHALKALRKVRYAFQRDDEGEYDNMSLEQVLKKLNLKDNPALITTFPITLSSSMLYQDVLESPAKFFFGKMKHHLGDANKARSWQLLDFRTQTYIDAMSDTFSDSIQLNSDVQSVVRDEQGVIVISANGNKERFDKVVFACNADQALAMIDNPTEKEQALLGAWRYQPGEVLVHTDKKHFPREKHWALYDYIYTNRNGKIDTSINAAYRFQYGVPDNSDYLGTQHPNYDIDKEKIEFKKVFRTPIFDLPAMDARLKMPSLNGINHSYFCGSHFGWGLHEDAIRSAVELSKSLGANW